MSMIDEIEKKEFIYTYIQMEGEKWKVEQSGHGMFRRKIHLLDEVVDSVSERSPMPTKTFFLILGFG